MLSGRPSEHDPLRPMSPGFGLWCVRGRKTGSVEPDRVRVRNKRTSIG
jgi:hypothetical protein